MGLPHDFITADLPNRLAPKTQDDIENPHIHLLNIIRNPDYFHFTCKHIFNIDLAPFQLVILEELWFRKYPMLIAARGSSKSFLLALYAMLRGLLFQGTKVVVCGASFRQAKVVFEYCEHMWINAPILRDIVGVGGRNGPRRDVDRCSLIMGDSVLIFLPTGDGQKIRGQRANIIIVDEYATVPKEIYETVISGFGSVKASPRVGMKHAARIRVMKKMGRWTEELEQQEMNINRGTQSILAGTAYFAFNHFYEYWKEYKGVIESKGDPKKLTEVFNGKIPPRFNWRNYSIIRLPVELVPEGFMDEEHIARSQITSDKGIYAVEYGAVFATDTAGFFKRSLIESCIVRHDNINLMLSGVTPFYALIKGDRARKYVFGIDTASERDNFVITILELWNNHRRVVYCWSTLRERHLEKVKEGTVKEKNYFAYCARKIRDLMKIFPCVHISMDSQGGGRQIAEALHDDDKMEAGELPIWEIRDPKKERWSDNQAGLHLLELVEFADAKWVSEANMGLKKDMEDKVLLFPYMDPVQLYAANKEDKQTGRVIIKGGREIRLQDTIEDVVYEIEQMQEELTTIEHTQTPGTNRDHWDTPEIKRAGGKKGRLRKDRYSAVLMANMAARQMAYAPSPVNYNSMGGFAKDISGKIKNTPLYIGPEWFTNPTGFGEYGMAVRRGGGDN